MSIFGTVSGKQVDDFAIALARELAEQFPPSQAAGEAPARSGAKKLVATLDALFGKAMAFRTQHKLGVYKKARLGNAFRWELQALGYEKAFVEDVTQRLVVFIARKS
jgi:hypothetical protein